MDFSSNEYSQIYDPVELDDAPKLLKIDVGQIYKSTTMDTYTMSAIDDLCEYSQKIKTSLNIIESFKQRDISTIHDNFSNVEDLLDNIEDNLEKMVEANKLIISHINFIQQKKKSEEAKVEVSAFASVSESSHDRFIAEEMKNYLKESKVEVAYPVSTHEQYLADQMHKGSFYDRFGADQMRKYSDQYRACQMSIGSTTNGLSRHEIFAATHGLKK